MTLTALPINASSGSPSYTSQQFRQAHSALLGNDSARPVGSRSGYGVGHQPATLTISGTTWTIGPFSCVIDPAFTTTQGPYLISNDANITGSISSDPSSPNTRIDLLYAQVSDTDIDSSGSRTVTVAVQAGTAGNPGVAPSLPARSLLLATINVPSSPGAPTITVNSQFSVASGGVLPVPSISSAPSSGVVEGSYIDDATNNILWRYTGSAWLPAGTLLSGTGGALVVGAVKSLTTVTSSGGQVSWAISGWASAPIIVPQILDASRAGYTCHPSAVTSTQVNVFCANAGTGLADGTAVTLHVLALGIPSAGSVPTL